jgi:hypothetical protein
MTGQGPDDFDGSRPLMGQVTAQYAIGGCCTELSAGANGLRPDPGLGIPKPDCQLLEACEWRFTYLVCP